MRFIRQHYKTTLQLGIYLLLGLVLLVCVKFSLDKSNIRNSVLTALQMDVLPEQLIVFTFSKAESEALNWRKNHEFELDGQMYDIVETKEENGILYYTCFHDVKETKYKRRFYKFLGKLMLPDHHKNGDQNTNQIGFKTYFCETGYQIDSELISGAMKESISIYSNLYSHLIGGPNAPPPKV